MINGHHFATVTGRIVRDVEVFISGQHTLYSFTVAYSKPYLNKQTNQWEENQRFMNMKCWNKDICKKLVKGCIVQVNYEPVLRSYNDKNGEKRWVTDLIAEKVVPLAKYLKNDGTIESTNTASVPTAATTVPNEHAAAAVVSSGGEAPVAAFNEVDEDDLPF